MICSLCSAEADDGSQFCEECGTVLLKTDDNIDNKLCCSGCGAGPNAIDGDGFCTQCGHRRQSHWRNHFEETLSVNAAGVSDIGQKYHENQDYFVLGQAESGEVVAFVCDGVSHSQNPMEGSKAACDTAMASVLEDLKNNDTEPETILIKALTRAQEAICQVPFVKGLTEMINRKSELIPPAQATAVGVIVRDRSITIIWLGDSRAYWVGSKQISQLTVDHSWLNEVVSEGEMSIDEASKDLRARSIVRSLGADFDGTNAGIEPQTLTLNLTEPGVLLVVSDGFYIYADDAKISDLVKKNSREDGALAIARKLAQFARDSGGRDNITVVPIIF